MLFDLYMQHNNKHQHKQSKHTKQQQQQQQQTTNDYQQHVELSPRPIRPAAQLCFSHAPPHQPIDAHLNTTKKKKKKKSRKKHKFQTSFKHNTPNRYYQQL
jgi:hypothetical protein